MKETAKEMAVSPSAFRTKVHRCRQRLMGQPEYANLLAEYRGMGDEDSGA
jgi:DNA-directed RNA polymerase specialized sigma24 family protein